MNLLHKTVVDGVDVDLIYQEGKLKIMATADPKKGAELVKKLIPGTWDDMAIDFLLKFAEKTADEKDAEAPKLAAVEPPAADPAPGGESA